jgi:hypothetical protein
MKSVLTLVLVGALAFSSLAMASDLGSSSPVVASSLSGSDSGFLFGKDQVAATTISSQEMQQTQGQLFSISGLLTPIFQSVTNTVGGLPVAGPTVSSLLSTVLSLVP